MRRTVGALLVAGMAAALTACGTYEFPVDRPTTTTPSTATPGRSATPDPLTRADVVGRHDVVGAPGAYVVLAGDGGVRGEDGCNQFGGGTWRLSGGRVELVGESVSTLVGCPDGTASDRLASAEVLEPRVDGGLEALDDSGRRVAILAPVD